MSTFVCPNCTMLQCNGACLYQKPIEQPVNPKTLAGSKKQSLFCNTTIAAAYANRINATGAAKYGRYNWLGSKLTLSVYIDAIERHLLLLKLGQDLASDSQLHHLGHILQTAAIALEATLVGNMVDDRTKVSEEHIKVLEDILCNKK